MGKRTSYRPGTFSWVDLATTNAAAAKSFYTGLFGWETEDSDAGNGSVYTLCRVEGDAVCGLYEMSSPTRAEGLQANWTSYVTVDDAEALAPRTEELGGVVLQEPFDVLDIGRMALLNDPQGAVLAVWQPRRRIGAERVNDVGCLCMNELGTTDVEAARAFYERLFGWTTEVSDMAVDGPPIVLVLNGGSVNGAVFETPEGVPAHWRPCFTVESIETALERVRDGGGESLLEPLKLDHGNLAMVRDPQGALFTMFAGETEP